MNKAAESIDCVGMSPDLEAGGDADPLISTADTSIARDDPEFDTVRPR